MDVRGRHHRPGGAPVVVFVQATGDLPLASFDFFAYLRTHSKTSVRWGEVRLSIHYKPQKSPKVFGFFHHARQAHHAGFAWLGTRFAKSVAYLPLNLQSLG